MLDLTPCAACGFEYATNMAVCPLCEFPRDSGEGGVREPRPDPEPESPARVDCPL